MCKVRSQCFQLHCGRWKLTSTIHLFRGFQKEKQRKGRRKMKCQITARYKHKYKLKANTILSFVNWEINYLAAYATILNNKTTKKQNKIWKWMKTNQRDTIIIITTPHKYKYNLRTKQSFCSLIENKLKINYLAMYTTILKEDRN